MRYYPNNPTRRSPRARRGAIISVEMLFFIPFILLLTFGAIEFSMLLTVRTQLLAASREGARVAAHGGTDGEVVSTVQRTLGGGNLDASNVDISRVEEDPRNAAVARDRVVVQVRVPITRVVPDLLRVFGISFRNQELVAAAVMNQE